MSGVTPSSAVPVERFSNEPTVFADDHTQLPNDHHNQQQQQQHASSSADTVVKDNDATSRSNNAHGSEITLGPQPTPALDNRTHRTPHQPTHPRVASANDIHATTAITTATTGNKNNPVSMTDRAPDGSGPDATAAAYDARLPWYTMPVSAAFRLTNHDLLASAPDGSASGLAHAKKNGFTAEAAARNGETLGTNHIPVKDGPSALKILAAQFLNSITAILAVVAAVSAAFQDWVEFGVVIAIIVINGALGFYQEYSAALSLDALKKMTSGTAKVVRDGGQIFVVDPSDLVVGDVVVLEQGDEVPADIRLFDVSNDLAINEALLTGEAEPVAKCVEAIPDPEAKCALGDRKNMAYRSTNVVSGRGRGIVVLAGTNTEMGKLADRLGEAENTRTPLMVKMDIMLYILFGCCAVLAVIVFAADKMRWSEKNLMYACAVAIAILPESLVVVLTVAMTLSIRRMAQEKCIVRKLGVLEVLGGVTDICSDKTGTLTENKMAVKIAFVGLDKSYSVHGAIRSPEGTLIERSANAVSFAAPETPQNGFAAVANAATYARLTAQTVATNRSHREFFRAASLCSSVRMALDPENPDELVAEGNPTEMAIQIMAWKADREPEYYEGKEAAVRVGEYPFNSTVKRMTTVYRVNEERSSAASAVANDAPASTSTADPSSAVYAFTKGAPERVLSLCEWRISDEDGSIVPITDADRSALEKHIAGMASFGLRTICFARRHTELHPFFAAASATDQGKGADDDGDEEEPAFDKLHAREDVEDRLIYLGLVGIQDPPRKESGPSVLICQNAGITVRMLTGDHGDTAAAIADNLGILSTFEDRSDRTKVMIGPDFDKMEDGAIDAMGDLPLVVGRCSPESKVKMIEALHRRGRVVAMTGDGFNDSPSIKKADVGCAMGSGTDVTKGVADIVITDDNFTTIVKAVREGRRISQVIKHFVVHLLTGNVAEVIALIIGLCIRHEDRSVFILSPLQILWLNMVTSSPPAIGLSMDEVGDDILERPPNTDGLFTAELVTDFMVAGAAIGACCLGSFAFVGYVGNDGLSGTDCNSHEGVGCDVIWTARATAFSVIYVSLLLHAYNVRHPRKSILQMKWFDNPVIYLNVLFGMGCLVICLYVEVIAKNVFIQKYLTWEWGVIAVALVIFEIVFELYKYSKRWLFPIRAVAVSPAVAERTHRAVDAYQHHHHDHGVDGEHCSLAATGTPMLSVRAATTPMALTPQSATSAVVVVDAASGSRPLTPQSAEEREAYRRMVRGTLDGSSDEDEEDQQQHRGRPVYDKHHDPRTTVQIAHDLMVEAKELRRQKTYQGEEQ